MSGADRAAAEALQLLQVAQPVESRLVALQRIGERRWDVVLDRGQRLMLPEDQPIQALERIIAMHQAVDMLSRDLTVVDLRLPQRPTIRMTSDAASKMWEFKAIEAGGVISQ